MCRLRKLVSIVLLLTVVLIGLGGCGSGSDTGAASAGDGAGSRLMKCIMDAGAKVANEPDEVAFLDESESHSSGAIYDADSGALVRRWLERGASEDKSGRWIVWSFDASSGDSRSVAQIVDGGAEGSAVLYMKSAGRASVAATEACLKSATRRNQKIYDQTH